MEKFAEYGFNRRIPPRMPAYYTAYLKTHHKVEFMAALLTSEIIEMILKYIAACKDNDGRQPDVQVSRREFIVRDEAVVYGLGGIKTLVMKPSAKSLPPVRTVHSFRSWILYSSACGKLQTGLESLIKGGAGLLRLFPSRRYGCDH